VTVETNGIPLRIERPPQAFNYSIKFKGTNRLRTRGNFGLDAASELPIADDGSVFPFRGVSENVSALLVTGADNDRLRFRPVRD